MSLIQMSLFGGGLILFIVVVRALALQRLPKITFLVLWEVAALRLLLPFSIPLPFSVFAPMERLAGSGKYRMAEIAAPMEPAAAGAPCAASTAASAAVHTVLPLVWLAGTVLLAAYFVVSYVRVRRKFRNSFPDDTPAVQNWLAGQKLCRRLEVRQSDQVSSPLTYGILHPVILLPKDMERGGEKALIYVLAHEFVHVRRFDAITKLFFAAVLCVHWFNPLVWVMYVLANRDLELSCDERVIDALGSREKASYALTLIAMEEARSLRFSPYNYFSKLAIKERIEAIMKYKKTSVLASALAVVLVLGATTVFAAAGAPASSAADPSVGVFLTDEDGNSVPVSAGQVVGVSRFSVDKDGRCTPDPDTDLRALLEALEIPECQFAWDSNVEYRLISKDEAEQDEDNIFLPPTRTEEEWQQIIADIESGKIPPFEIPDDPNVTVDIVDYSNGSCAAEN